MASAQGVAQLNDKEKAVIAEAISEAQNQVANNNAKVSQQQIVLTVGAVKNVQRRGLRLAHTHNMRAMGYFKIEPPQTLGDGVFVHEGATSGPSLPFVVGSKGAIVYDTMDRMEPGLGYLVAWYKPEHTSTDTTKVYVEAGNSAKFANIDWKEIEEKLDASGRISRYWDSETGAAVAAEIKDDSEKVAVLGAMFDTFNK